MSSKAHKMEAHINFIPKTKQLRKFKLFESKEVKSFVKKFSCIFWSGLTRFKASSWLCLSARG